MTNGAASVFSQFTVTATPDLARIIALPRRNWRTGYGATVEEQIAAIVGAYRRAGCTMVPRPVQAAALCEMHDCGGALIPAGVGEGKTFMTALASRVLEAKRPLLLIPAKLREKTERDFEILQRGWVIQKPRIESYEMLSRECNANYLNEAMPDLIIGDEVHKLKNRRAAVTRRVGRYIREHRPAFVGLSGTITKRSLMEYWHLIQWALGPEYMPLPQDWREAQAWAGALDAKKEDVTRTRPGALMHLCPPGTPETLENARAGYMERLTSTPGVVATMQSDASCSIYIDEVRVQLDHLEPLFKRLREDWETPDGHPFMEAVDLWRHARELVCGFYYVWDPRPPREWLNVRKAWCQYVRETLKHSQKLDTMLQVVKAIDAGHMGGDGPRLLAEWRRVEPTFEPNVVPVWVDDTTLKVAARWLVDHVGIVWVEHRAFGEKLARMTGLPYYGSKGLDARRRNIEDETGPCIASIAANGEGRNLQRYHKGLVVSCPPNGTVWEQLIGRFHRPGQLADEVSFSVVQGCIEQWSGMQRAFGDARMFAQTLGASQKLLIADVTLPTPGEVALRSSPLWRKPTTT